MKLNVRNSLFTRLSPGGGTVEIGAVHTGGIVHGGRVVIERNDVRDLLILLREALADLDICEHCEYGGYGCQCQNDE